MTCFYETLTVKVAEELYVPDEIHTNCSKDDIKNQADCNVINGFLTCSSSKCGDFASQCVCHVVTDMGG